MPKQMKMTVNPGQTMLTIEFLAESGASGRLELSRDDLAALATTLNDLHTAMVEGKDTRETSLLI